MHTIILFRGFSIFLTILYCVIVWYAMALWSTFLGFGHDPSLFTELTIEPLKELPIYLYAIHWQVAAIGWLIYNLYTEKNRGSDTVQNAGHTLVLQLSWIIMCILFHTLGAVTPMIAIGFII